MKKLLRWLRPAGPWILAWAAVASGAEAGFDFDTLRARARDLAAQVPRPSQGEVPAWLRELSYDDLRRIEFDGRQSLWHGEGRAFQVQFLHPGFLFDRSVRVFELDGGRVTAVPFRREYFHYRGAKSGELPATMGFAGFRLMYPLDGSGAAPSEVGSFAGASYFRFLGAGAAYGLSARGLALDTAAAGPEEFPRFTEFWLERPAAGARSMAVLALLESERVTGAYRFTIAPGETTIVDVRAALYFRRPAGVVGLAPLTSMFWRGENSPATVDDYRPEVHDSDGLLLHRGNGEWIWRPLVNPRQVRVATFADENPRGFGLLQRDRDLSTTRISRPLITGGRACGWSREADGGAEGYGWSRFRRRPSSMTTWWRSGCRKPGRGRAKQWSSGTGCTGAGRASRRRPDMCAAPGAGSPACTSRAWNDSWWTSPGPRWRPAERRRGSNRW
jgi:glucans biosynthesis protein